VTASQRSHEAGAGKAAVLLRRVATLFSMGLLGQAVGIGAGIVQAHALGPAGKGVLAYAVIALSLVLIGTDGLSSAVLMQAARAKERLGRIHIAMAGLVAAIALPCVLVALGIGIAFPSQRPLIGAAFAIPFALYVQGARGIFLASGATGVVAVQGAVTTVLLNLALVAALIFGHFDPYALLALWAGGQAAAAGYTAFELKRRTPRSSYADAGGPSLRKLAEEQFGFGMRTSLATVAAFVNMRIDVFVVSAVLGAHMLGIYTLAVGTGELLWSVSLPILYAALENIAGDPFAVSAALTARLMRAVVALQVALGAILFVAGPWLIVHVYGAAFGPAGDVLRILLPGLVVYAVETFLGYFILVQVKRPMLLFAVHLTSATICAGISLALLPHFGLVSAAAATTTTYLAVVLFKSLFFRHVTGIGLREQWVLRSIDLMPLMVKVRAKLQRSGRPERAMV
jgi:O-antigen/teichoic acid export membrane protein